MNVDFQEKMDPTHRMYLCQMLKVKNLSEDLLGRYAQVKTLLDRIDGHFTPCGLALIIVSTVESICQGEDEAEKPLDEAEKPLDEADDKVIEEAVETKDEQPVSGATGQAADKPDPDEGKAMLWAPGMPVRVLQDDELMKGKIVGVGRVTDEGYGPRLTVEFEDGETATVDEDECEAI